ncbi:hypothetical protein RJ639_029693 [Escallonia herrerae]|uniref:Protein kinase domain-containing protein n=1 Tax=Escallonia herrerae TaxID=1293975 RepID=A0AA88WZT6_9ASTE|nr:hypothetical protein RJ639_029693 [Escallonia herrerae]
MNVGGTAQQKRGTLFSPRHSPLVAGTPPSKPAATQSSSPPTSCCRGFNDCMIMGSTTTRQPTLKLEQQVAELEKEVLKQLRAMYRMRMERTQDYLRYCLQIAQENGFLDIIVNNKDDQQQCLLSSSNIPPSPPPVQMQHHPDLSAVTDLAKTNGWYIEPHEIELHEKVGQGSTAEIYRATWRGLEVAVKCIYPDFFDSNENGVGFFAQEVETLSRQRHRFVLQLMGACLDPPNYGWVVTEFLGTTLKEWMHGPGSRRKQRLVPLPPLGERVAKALQIAQAMQYLHEHKPMVMHRDLKPSNIFLDDSMHVRVADFGHARFLTDGEKALTGETGKNALVIFLDLIALEVGEGKLRPALPKQEGQVDEELIELIQLSWDEDAARRPSFVTITCRLRAIQSRFVDAL